MGRSRRTMKEFSEQMLAEKVFECILCTEILSPPIMQVENLGNICGPCFGNNYRVNKWKAMRNTKLEKVLGELVVPCRYEENGCKHKVAYKKLEKHEDKCRHRVIQCLSCCWQGSPRQFHDHFPKQHPEHVVKSDHDQFSFDLNLLHFTQPGNRPCCDVIKFLKNKKSSCLVKMQKRGGDIWLTLCAAREKHFTPSNYTIRHVGRNTNTTYIQTECELTKLSTFNGKRGTTRIDLHNLLKTIASRPRVPKTLSIVIYENKKKEWNADEKTLECLECPVCNEAMRPPIFLCCAGHSLCKVCRPQLRECPICRGPMGNTRNYALEALAQELLGCEHVDSSLDGAFTLDPIDELDLLSYKVLLSILSEVDHNCKRGNWDHKGQKGFNAP